MAQVELIMPKMGESIIEATILKWVKKEGDTVDVDETILEIATDKVDSEIPSPVSGKILKTFFDEDTVVEIGKVIAIIGTEGEESVTASAAPTKAEEVKPTAPPVQPSAPAPAEVKQAEAKPVSAPAPAPAQSVVSTDRFYSPLVRNIASKEGVSQAELDAIPGTGKNGRLTKKDILAYLSNGRVSATPAAVSAPATATPEAGKSATPASPAPAKEYAGNVEIVEMDRMRKMIAKHMVMSKHTSPHVTSFVEVDVTNMVNWRNNIKGDFIKKFGEKITFTPLFIEAVIKALKDFPLVNVSVDGDNVIIKKDINIGMAAALPSGNLIVPVIKNADHLNLVGLTSKVNDLANRARNNALKPEEIQDGTFTITNVGTFGNVMGTPIINQPQVAILAVGAIRKKPAVIETENGDLIGIRSMMFLSLSYDHRVVDGVLGGSFLRKIGDYLEDFDHHQTV